MSRSPIGTDHVGPEHRVFEVCALYGDEPSARSEWLLQLLEAEEAFERDPADVLQRIHGLSAQEPSRGLVFALAELSYLAGKRSGEPRYFLLAAVASFTYLGGEDRVWGPPASPFLRRFRWACEIYNRSVGRAFAGEQPGTLQLVGGSHDLPVGTLDVAVDLTPFPFEDEGLVLHLADERELRGLDLRVRDSGLGAPLIAVVQRRLDTTAAAAEEFERTSVSATAFLRLEGDLTHLEDGLAATLELHSTYDATTVEVAGRSIPLEADQSSTVAFGTELAEYWRHDLSGLFQGTQAAYKNGLILPRPYEPGRIPVVLVHGTGSSPAYWAEMMNTLGADPVIRSRFQFWLFMYSTGNPIAYSAGSLREELTDFIAARDPTGSDPALRRMVVIGHSQGGLLVKMLGVSMSADELAQRSFGSNLDELELSEANEKLIRRLLDIEPVAFVERLVFVATPHRGSFLAKRWYVPALARMIAVPGEVARLADGILSGMPEDELPRGMKKGVRTSLENMNPDSEFLATLLKAPLDPRLELNSIIPIGDNEQPEGAHDGVVEYESAHLDGVESEYLLNAPHSCQADPRVVVEVRRILRAHLGLESASLPGELNQRP